VVGGFPSCGSYLWAHRVVGTRSRHMTQYQSDLLLSYLYVASLAANNFESLPVHAIATDLTLPLTKCGWFLGCFFLLFLLQNISY
jgi:hypothetical protein